MLQSDGRKRKKALVPSQPRMCLLLLNPVDGITVRSLWFSIVGSNLYVREGAHFPALCTGKMYCSRTLYDGSHKKSLQGWLTCRFYTILLMQISVSDDKIVCYIVGNAITNTKVRWPSPKLKANEGRDPHPLPSGPPFRRLLWFKTNTIQKCATTC